MKKGFSLPELIIAITITALVVEAAYFASRIGQASFKSSSEKIEITQTSRVLLDRISRELRQATAIATDLPATPDDPENPAPAEIMFEDGHVAINRYISYQLSGTNINRIMTAYYFGESLPDSSEWVVYNATDSEGNPPNSAEIRNDLIANNISSLEIYGDAIIYINLTASKNGQRVDFLTSINPRNL